VVESVGFAPSGRRTISDSSGNCRHAGGLGIVNSANPKLFESLTPEQADAGKEYLSTDWNPKKDTETERHFNLDGAKLLYVLIWYTLFSTANLTILCCRLQFAALVYEHPNQAVRNAVLVAAEAQGIKGGLFGSDQVPKVCCWTILV